MISTSHSAILFARRFRTYHLGLRQRLSGLGVNDSPRDFVCVLPGAEPDVDIDDLRALFDFDDLRLIPIGRVGVEGFGVFSLRVAVSPFAARADYVAPGWQAVDAIYAAIIRAHHHIVVVIESSVRLAIFIHG